MQLYVRNRVADRAAAEAFMATPEAQQAGLVAGVIDGEYHFIEPA